VIRGFSKGGREPIDARRLRQRCTLTTCISTIAVRHAVVACRYSTPLVDSG
jgi:hypothetical protein